MKKKWVLYAIIGGVLVVGYAIYAIFFLETVKIGELCKGNAQCKGECLGFGELLPDYSHKQICTKECKAASDCPSPTTCQEIDVTEIGNAGASTSKKSYCLPEAIPR